MQIEGHQPPEKVSRVADELTKLMSHLLQAAALAGAKAGAESDGSPGKLDKFSALYVAAVGCTSGLHVLASIVGHHGDPTREKVENEEVHKCINPTSILFSALLCHAMAPEASHEGVKDNGAMVGMNIEFGNATMFEALQQVERFTGRPVDGWLNPSMLAEIRKAGQGADDPLKEFLAQHRQTPGGLH